MKKLLTSILLACMCMMFVVPTNAEEKPTVEFDGSTELKYNMDKHAFGTNFEGMLPAEERTQSIVLKNTSDREVDFYMSTEVIEVFEEARESAKNGGYTVALTLLQDGHETLVYGNKEEMNVGANENGLFDMNGSLNDMFMIAQLQPGKEAVVSLSVKLDGQSIRNDYQGLPGTFQFDFTVQYDNTEPETVINKIVNTIKGESVVTSDTMKVGVFTFVAVASAGAFIALRKGGRKDEE